jgi:hypothetical protein
MAILRLFIGLVGNGVSLKHTTWCLKDQLYAWLGMARHRGASWGSLHAGEVGDYVGLRPIHP